MKKLNYYIENLLDMNEALPNLCSCDVTDKEKLAIFRKKRSEWYQAVVGNDTHSIKNQLNNHRLKPVGWGYGLKVRIRVD